MAEEIKPVCVVRAPCATRSGYGDASRDIIRHIIEYDKFDVKVLSVPWGETPMNALSENDPRDKMILDRLLTSPLERQPELFVSITVPNEFESVGKFNIGITAGIETTAAAPQWVAGCNKMDVVFVMSEHSKKVLEQSRYGFEQQNGEKGILQITKPIEVLHNCVNTEIFGKKAPVDSDFVKRLNEIPEKFCYLFVGHWLAGDMGEDRKNVGFLIKMFLETFKQVNSNDLPALILKTSNAGFSILDREEIAEKVKYVRNTVRLEPGQRLPNIYLVHGELTEKEMNTLYNHSKVKVHVSFTKGEGFGRPLLEASVSGKPIIASGWSGQVDFLDINHALLVGGELKNVHKSAAWKDVIMEEAKWFSPDPQQSVNALAAPFFDYNKYKEGAYNLAIKNRQKFSYDQIKKNTFELLDKYVPEFPKEMKIILPSLKKVTLPKLKKVDNGVTE